MEEFTILAVDDSTFVLDALKTINTSYKKKFDFAKDGFEALAKFQGLSKQGHLYHLILMDLMMPNCDGFKATQLIREFETKTKCPTSFICGLSSFDDQGIFLKILIIDNFRNKKEVHRCWHE